MFAWHIHHGHRFYLYATGGSSWCIAEYDQTMWNGSYLLRRRYLSDPEKAVRLYNKWVGDFESAFNERYVYMSPAFDVPTQMYSRGLPA